MEELIQKFRTEINIYIESHKSIEQIMKEIDDLQLCHYYYNIQKDLKMLCKFSGDL